MLGAEYIADFLLSRGIRRIFTFPGGTVAPLYEACRQRGIEILVARHEQGAGYAALAVARLTRTPQVFVVTSGPGVTNAVTPLADAFFDSTPLVLLTGQVGTGDLLSGRRVRQCGFQQVDTLALVRPVTKGAFLPLAADELPATFAEAFTVATEGRPGPVVVDLPMNVQRTALTRAPAVVSRPPVAPPAPSDEAVATLAEWLATAARPVLLAGQGVLLAGAEAELRALADEQGLPVVLSLLGLGAYPSAAPRALGFLGHTGNQCANRAIHEADLVVVLGARLDVRQTGSETARFVPGGRVVRVDLDEGELADGRVRTDLVLHADVGATLRALRAALVGRVVPDRTPWQAAVAAWKTSFALRFAIEDGPLKPQHVVAEVARATAGRAAVVVSGVGSHQQWAARHFDFDHPRRVWLTSGGHGAMGYDLPSTIGAALARPDAVPICFVGDGSFQLNLQELRTALDWGTPVKVFVLDNARLALVSQFQLLNWAADPTTGAKTNPDFAAIAAAYGIASFTLREPRRVAEVVAAALAVDGPAVVHCLVDPREEVSPMLLAGQTMDAMWFDPRDEEER